MSVTMRPLGGSFSVCESPGLGDWGWVLGSGRDKDNSYPCPDKGFPSPPTPTLPIWGDVLLLLDG